MRKLPKCLPPQYPCNPALPPIGRTPNIRLDSRRFERGQPIELRLGRLLGFAFQLGLQPETIRPYLPLEAHTRPRAVSRHLPCTAGRNGLSAECQSRCDSRHFDVTDRPGRCLSVLRALSVLARSPSRLRRCLGCLEVSAPMTARDNRPDCELTGRCRVSGDSSPRRMASAFVESRPVEVSRKSAFLTGCNHGLPALRHSRLSRWPIL